MATLLFDDIKEGLELVACPFQPPNVAALKGMLGGSSCSKMFTKIVVWICEQMKGHVEPVAMPQGPDEEPLFRVELSTVLMDLGCPVPNIGGAASLSDPNNRTAVLHYLIHELMSVRLGATSQTKTKQINTEKGCFSGHPALQDLAMIYNILELPSPGSEDEIPDIFDTILHRINEISTRNGESLQNLLSDPILKFSLKPEEWGKLEEVCHVLNEEYTIRFKTLLKRLDLTLTSFKWGKNAKEKAETLDKVYAMQRRLMNDTSNLGVADILSARVDLACIPKTSSGVVRDNTKTKLNKMVIVGKVPDRGGRPLEQRPEPEIPSWLKDKNKGGRGNHYQQSRGGQSQAAGGNRYQQQNDRNRQQNQGYHQNRGYHDRMNQGQQQNQGYQQQNQGYQQQNQGYQQQNQGHQQQNQGHGSYRRTGYQNNRGGRGGNWGGYRGGGNQGGVY